METSSFRGWQTVPADILLIIMEYTSYQEFLESPPLQQIPSRSPQLTLNDTYKYGLVHYRDEGISAIHSVCAHWNAGATASPLTPLIISYTIELRPLTDAVANPTPLVESIIEFSKKAQVELSLQLPLVVNRNILFFLSAVAPYLRRLALTSDCDPGDTNHADPLSQSAMFFPKLLELCLHHCSRVSVIRKPENAPRLLRLSIQDDDLSLISQLRPSYLYVPLCDTRMSLLSAFGDVSKFLVMLSLSDPCFFSSWGLGVLTFPALRKFDLGCVSGFTAICSFVRAVQAPSLESLRIGATQITKWNLASPPMYLPSLFKYPILKRISLGGFCPCAAIAICNSSSCPQLEDVWIAISSRAPVECPHHSPYRIDPVLDSQTCLAHNVHIINHACERKSLMLALSATSFPFVESLSIQWGFRSIGIILDDEWHGVVTMPRLKRLLVKSFSGAFAAYAGMPLRLVAISPGCSSSFSYAPSRRVLEVKTAMWDSETLDLCHLWDFPVIDTIGFTVRDLWTGNQIPLLDGIGQLLVLQRPGGSFTSALAGSIKRSLKKVIERDRKATTSVPFPLLSRIVLVLPRKMGKFMPYGSLETLKKAIEYRESMGRPIREVVCSLPLEYEVEKKWFAKHEIEWKHLSPSDPSFDLLVYRDALFPEGNNGSFKMWIGRKGWN